MVVWPFVADPHGHNGQTHGRRLAGCPLPPLVVNLIFLALIISGGTGVYLHRIKDGSEQFPVCHPPSLSALHPTDPSPSALAAYRIYRHFKSDLIFGKAAITPEGSE